MPVIIKDMDMPGSCFTCRFLHGVNRTVNRDGEKIILVGCHVDSGTMELLEKTGRRKDCPLEEA